MKSKIVVTFLLVLYVLLTQACQSSTTVVSSDIAAYPTVRPLGEAMGIVPDPHHHSGEVNNNWLWKQNAPDFEMVKVRVSSTVAQETVNQKGTFSAFTSCDETCRIFVKDFTTDRIYELKAPSFLSSRPFSDLVWASEEILVFDQWTQPNHGVHYAVNVREQGLVLASPFPDS